MKSISGMSIIEVTVAAVIMGVFFLVLGRLSIDFAKSQKSMDVKDEFNKIYSDLRRTISNKDQCAKLFHGRTVTRDANGIVNVTLSTPVASDFTLSADPLTLTNVPLNLFNISGATAPNLRSRFMSNNATGTVANTIPNSNWEILPSDIPNGHGIQFTQFTLVKPFSACGATQATNSNLTFADSNIYYTTLRLRAARINNRVTASNNQDMKLLSTGTVDKSISLYVLVSEPIPAANPIAGGTNYFYRNSNVQSVVVPNARHVLQCYKTPYSFTSSSQDRSADPICRNRFL